MAKLDQVPSVRRRAREIRSTGLQPVSTDETTEELSDAAVRAIEEGRADHAAGRTLTLAEIKRELGIES